MPKRQRVLLSLLIFLVCDALLVRLWDARYDPVRPQASRERRFRRPSPIYHHDLVPGYVPPGWLRKPMMITNSLGFRDGAPRTVSLRPAGRRLVLIGDSFVESQGVYWEQSFPGLVAEALRPEGTEVLNAGVVSYSPIIYWRKLKYLVEEVGLRFSDLIVFIDISDICDEAVHYDLRDGVVVDRLRMYTVDCLGQPLPPSEREEAPLDYLRRSSLLLRVGIGLVERVRFDPWTIEDPTGFAWRRSAWTTVPALRAHYGAVGLARARHYMTELAKLMKAYGVRMSIVVYPWPHQILHRDRDSIQVSYWRTFAHEHGLGFLDLFPRFINGQDPLATYKRYFILGDIHWGPAGHRLVADALLAYWKTQHPR
ncbi:MAG: hypothetical protein RMK29_14465 [Myxococcales bacterium]|nr:hypothetical protein [Myxococcota bacterium]MDW8282915.1 hypothetical protein [Myxococcales bacterium]